MDKSKPESDQTVERSDSRSPTINGQTVREVEHGNEAVLLRVGDSEKGSHRNLKLAKDGCVSRFVSLSVYEADVFDRQYSSLNRPLTRTTR